MENFEKKYEKLKNYIKDNCGSYADDIISKIIVEGVTQNENGELHGNYTDSSWERLVKESENEEYKGINQLGYSLNSGQKKGEFDFVTFYSLGQTSNGHVTKFFVGEKEFETTKENKLTSLFKTMDTEEKDGEIREVFRPNINKRYGDPFYHRLFHSEFFPCEAVTNDGETKTLKKNRIGKADKNLMFFHRIFSTSARNVMIACTKLEDSFEEVKEKIEDMTSAIRRKKEFKVKRMNIEKRSFKKDVARAIALVEKYPFLALYAPAVLMNEKIFKEAVNEGFKFNKMLPIAWDKTNIGVRAENGNGFIQVPVEKVILADVNNVDYDSFIEQKSNFQRNLENYGGELTFELIADELEKARREVAETLKREVPKIYTSNDSPEEQEKRMRAFLGEDEEEVKASSKEKSKDDPLDVFKDMIDEEAEVDQYNPFDEDEEDEDEFPF